MWQETGRVEIRVHKNNTVPEVCTLALGLKMKYACKKLREEVGSCGSGDICVYENGSQDTDTDTEQALGRSKRSCTMLQQFRCLQRHGNSEVGTRLTLGNLRYVNCCCCIQGT